MSAPSRSPLSTAKHPPQPGTCSACGAALLWTVGVNGKRQPLNAEPRPDGNIWISRDGRAHYRSLANPIPEGADRYTSHFATCEHAEQFRRRP
jgi:hypothetical protein